MTDCTSIPGVTVAPNPSQAARNAVDRLMDEREAWRNMAEAQAKLLAAYRLGYTGERAGKAVGAVSEARAHLEYLKQDTSKV